MGGRESSQLSISGHDMQSHQGDEEKKFQTEE